MKNQTKFILLSFLIGYTAFSQEVTPSVGEFNTEAERLNVISNFNYSQVRFNDNATVNERNAVIIQQIGDNNQVFSRTTSQSSNINLYQKGDFNTVSLDVNAPTIEANVVQNGNDNYVLDYIYYSNLDVKLNAVQNGNNLTINRIGVNSLSNKLQLVQEGSFKTITVISN